MAKITSRKSKDRETIVVKTLSGGSPKSAQKWWKGSSKAERGAMLLDTTAFIKEQLQFRYRQASTQVRLYSNMPMMGVAGTNFTKFTTNTLPADRPTMNVIQSCVDTLVSRITQSKPKPTFLTDNGDYRQRKLGKQLNEFGVGELYRSKAYDLGEMVLRDAAVLGTGCIKVMRGQDDKVHLERRMATELLVDPNDSLYGTPRQLIEVKLVDRAVLAEMFPSDRSKVTAAEQAYPEAGEQSKTISDQVMVAEGWHLPSGPDADDGMHMIVCSSGVLFEEKWERDSFPFVFLHYSPRLLGFWGQALTEQLMGTQMEINKLLMTISRSINLVGVPRVFVEDGSKVVKAHLNNEIGSIVTYRGTKPEYSVAPVMPAEVYAQLQRLVDYAYQQSGISALAAASKKPEGLDSGAAIREYDDLQSDRFASLNKRYDNMFIDLVVKIIEEAQAIVEDTGKYSTVYPNKNGVKQIDLPKADLINDPFVIQCFDASALPRDPAGRMQKVVEMLQSGMIDLPEARRLLDYPDLEQTEKLANSGEERILQVLDEIVLEGKYTPPDPFMALDLAMKLSIQYYNLYVPAKLEEKRAEMLRQFNSQVQALKQAMMPPPAPMGAPAPQLAQAEPVPTSPLIPQGQPQG